MSNNQQKLTKQQDQSLQKQELTKQQDQSLQKQELTKQQDQSLRKQELTKQQDQSLLNDKFVSKKLIIGSLIATLVALTPYLFSLYESVPNTPVWDTFLFTYNSGFFGDANYAMWVLTGKLIPLYILFIWFFTCRHWWYHTLLVPIAMYIFQIGVVFSGESKIVDEFQLIYLLPIMAIVIPTIYLIRAKMFNQINTASKSLQELEDEFKISPKSFWGKVKQYF
ncbi:hypothetical protein ACGK9U_10485 [Mariniflexile sp. HNIBRBA6329]|uniref:hypothetical protein n=1 Tax=Mariniflexile sp. HNIBRBA6329 TaxID=3373088 RepID=UPI0037459283